MTNCSTAYLSAKKHEYHVSAKKHEYHLQQTIQFNDCIAELNRAVGTMIALVMQNKLYSSVSSDPNSEMDDDNRKHIGYEIRRISEVLESMMHFQSILQQKKAEREELLTPSPQNITGGN